MPEQETLQRARRDAAQGKSPSTQAGEFVREQIHHIREGRHGARSTKQAIAIALSEARRSGVPLAPPKGQGETTRKARRDVAAGARGKKPSVKRSRASVKALKKEPRTAASRTALSRQAKQAARKRGPRARSQAAKKAARTRQRAAR
ncbi:MAG: DNA-binding protein [Opitutaceae bacterium]